MNVSEDKKLNSKDIDAVITWIDGNDKKHRLKRLDTLNKITGSVENLLPTGSDRHNLLIMES